MHVVVVITENIVVAIHAVETPERKDPYHIPCLNWRGDKEEKVSLFGTNDRLAEGSADWNELKAAIDADDEQMARICSIIDAAFNAQEAA